MSQQVNVIQKQIETTSQVTEQNRFQTCEEIVDTLVEEGLPSSFVPEKFMSRISETYGVTKEEARTCLKLALKQLELNKQEEIKEENKLNGQIGYFYPQGYTTNNIATKHNDGMDSLSSLSSYNKLMFGIR